MSTQELLLPQAPRLSDYERRGAIFCATLNGLLWAIGSGLLGSQLVVYLAQEFHVDRIGQGIGLILAAPYFVGVLRLAAPAMIARLTNRKAFCIACFIGSGIVLSGIPLLAVCIKQLSASLGMALLVVLWCGYNLLEYLGLVALLSWLADVVPQHGRGNFLGRRERWMAAGQAAAMLASAGMISMWERYHSGGDKGIGLALSAAIGAFFVLAAALPLIAMPAAEARPASNREQLSIIFAPLFDRPFLGLLLAGIWFSFTNGLIQAPQGLYPIRVLQLSLPFMLCLRVGLRCGQWPIAPSVGKLADLFGNWSVMAVSLVFVAMGPLCYCFATRERYGWIITAWVCWIGWVGYNIGLPNILLKVAPRAVNSSYVALYYAAIGLSHGGGSFLGGLLFDRYGKVIITSRSIQLSYYQIAFLGGAFAYLVSAAMIYLLIREPRLQHSDAALKA